MKTLYILCGIPACGKSTWARKFCANKRIAYVSRDEIRFAMLKDGEDYFAHEKEVFKRFVSAIVHFLPYDDVVADATHLNEFSRRKLTQAIDMQFKDYNIIYVTFDVDLNVCLERNKNREGRAVVPELVMKNMARDFKIPSMEEDERAQEVIVIKGDG